MLFKIDDVAEAINVKKTDFTKVEQSVAVDFILWLNYGGHKKAVANERVGRKDLSKTPNLSVYQFYKRVSEILFNKKANPEKVQSMLNRVTNQMSYHEEKMIYKALAGEIEWDNKDSIAEYVNGRTIDVGPLKGENILPSDFVSSSEKDGEEEVSSSEDTKPKVEKSGERVSKRRGKRKGEAKPVVLDTVEAPIIPEVPEVSETS